MADRMGLGLLLRQAIPAPEEEAEANQAFYSLAAALKDHLDPWLVIDYPSLGGYRH